MKKRTSWAKRTVALLLVVTIAIGMVGCGKRSETEVSTESGKDPTGNVSTDKLPSDYDREDMELIVDLVGNGQSTDGLSDKELGALVDELISDMGDQSSNVTNLGSSTQVQEPTVDLTDKDGIYDENGAMTTPFDQVYPELIEQEQVAFSGESILIKLTSGELTDSLKAAGIGALEEIVPMGEYAWYEARLVDDTDTKEALAAVRVLDEVLLAEYNYEVKTAALDDYKHFDKEKDEEFKKNGHNKDQWHFHYCGIVDGYDSMKTTGGDPSVVVAVIDSGVDYDHEDLKDNMWVNAAEIPDNGIDDDGNGYVDDYYGVDIISGQGNGDDTNGHGTHVAGIIAARNNNTGVLGIAYNVKIMSVKAAAHNGTLNQADIARAVLYAYEMGAEVINMSFGGSACSIAVQDALATAYTRCVLVASAGNDGLHNEGPYSLPNYPAALTYVLGVMSVDETGRESTFTNWDVIPYSGIEYELYAPGESIMSTLPDDQYGMLSGTSMAAPVVSAFAAILRSEFADRDKYPTKFIYGQLASTSGNYADCLNPELHGPHNIPQIANLNDALTKMPKPELNVQDYAVFDDPQYSDKNNGDGVIDAGETIALGLTLRNRWGMSENTLVTIDTISENSGKADPYFTIHNATVDYGSVGTYSTQDCGKIYTDGMLTGWENPFLITVSEDCPNDYHFTLNVTITCENALDEADTTVYRFESPDNAINEAVRNGVVLPSIIEKDMVLTADNLYIIPRATMIKEGVTVRVEPGTHIQFWSDDPNDPYAEEGIAFLQVEGNFLVEGTKDNPVYIYPSELMSDYIVDLGESGSGMIRLEYADITNLNSRHTSIIWKGAPYRGITYAYGCTFRQNYGAPFRYREMIGGTVSTRYLYDVYIGKIQKAEKCVFYKLGISVYSPSDYIGAVLWGTADTCIFVECAMGMDSDELTVKNCVFLGNRIVDETDPTLYDVSALLLESAAMPEWKAENFHTYYRPETATTYVLYYHGGATELITPLHGYMEAMFSGDYGIIETEEELAWLFESGPFSDVVGEDNYVSGIQREGAGFRWCDGTEVADFLISEDPACLTGYFDPTLLVTKEGTASVRTDRVASRILFELPGQVLPEDITFAAYTVALDMDSVCQLAPQSSPVQLSMDSFVYESTNEAVVVVSPTGLLTAVGQGTADVWVWSADKAVRNRVTVTVQDRVPLEGITFAADRMAIAVGDFCLANITLTPADTTRRNVTFTTSDASVAAVDQAGNITGVRSGTATITATCEGLSVTVDVDVYVKATSLQMSSIALGASLGDGTVALPTVITSSGAETDLYWRSTDETVAKPEGDQLKLLATGTTSIVVTDTRSGLSAACLVCVSNSEFSSVKDVRVSDTDHHTVLLEDGSLYFWNNGDYKTPVLIAEDVKLFDSRTGWCGMVMQDGTIKECIPDAIGHEAGIFVRSTACVGWDIVDFVHTPYDIFVVTGDGNVYAWGQNEYGCLGVGLSGYVDEPTLVNLDGVTNVERGYSSTYFLTKTGDLYVAGQIATNQYSATPVLIDTNVAELVPYVEGDMTYRAKDGNIKAKNSFYETSTILTIQGGFIGFDQVVLRNTLSSGVGIKDGRVYLIGQDGTKRQVVGITDATAVYSAYGIHYIVTSNGGLLAMGSNTYNHIPGVLESTVVSPIPVLLTPTASESVTVLQSNLQGGVLKDEALSLGLNKALISANGKLYADGRQITVQLAITGYNGLAVSRTDSFNEGVSYELVFEPGTLCGAGGISNSEEVRVAFTYTAANKESEPGTTLVYESIVDETVTRYLTPESLAEQMQIFREETQLNPNFIGNAVLNPITTDTNVEHWLRPYSNSVYSYTELPLGGNYWGTTNETLISKQLLDYNDIPNYARLMYAPYLTEAPENTFPFVVSVKLFNKDGQEVTTVGNETVTFQVNFNRDMDTSIPLLVRFGSAYPYGDYEVAGEYVDARTWEGTYTLNTLIENGNQYFTISNGCSATDDLDLQLDRQRFGFVIDTTAAQALLMQGTATDTGIQLRWTQDDFVTLMGYNVYRSDREDGLYTRLNKTVIPADTMEFFDDTVEPGQVYYYNFTVVQTDLNESEPSGKIVIMSKDTMAPNIYHSPVANAFTGANLVVSATVTDNLSIAYANLYYRVVGSDTWKTVRMNGLNDRYSGIIPAADITLEGVEYYIEAFDGVSYTYRASAEVPYTISVQEAVDANALGDVDGDGVITNLDAIIVLYAINDKYNMTAEEFARADLNGDGELWAAEALRILQYVNGVIGSVKM